MQSNKTEILGNTLGERFRSWQQEFDFIGEVRGLGAMRGLELLENPYTKEPSPDKAASMIEHCYERGLIVLKCGVNKNIVRTLIPLVITDDQLERGLSIMEDGLKAISTI